MRFERVFHPVRIVFDTPEEIECLTNCVCKSIRDMETSWYGFRNSEIPESKRKSYYFLKELHAKLMQTPTRKEFSNV